MVDKGALAPSSGSRSKVSEYKYVRTGTGCNGRGAYLVEVGVEEGSLE